MGQPTKQARVDGAQDSSQERVTRRISRLLDLIYKLYASSSRSEPAGETMEASSSVPQPLAVYQQPQKKRGRKPAPFDCGADFERLGESKVQCVVRGERHSPAAARASCATQAQEKGC